MTKAETLQGLRRVMDHIHELGNIFYDSARYEAYAIIARIASDLRAEGEYGKSSQTR